MKCKKCLKEFPSFPCYGTAVAVERIESKS